MPNPSNNQFNTPPNFCLLTFALADGKAGQVPHRVMTNRRSVVTPMAAGVGGVGGEVG